MYVFVDYFKANTHFFCLKIINPQNIDKNILEISDQNALTLKLHFYIF